MALASKFDARETLKVAPTMPPTYIFIRHGEALHNVSARKHGPIAYTFPENEDAPLSDEGHRQTRQAGNEIANLIGDTPVHIYSSPLTRCIQTADAVGSFLNVKHKYMDDDLIERLGDGHVCNARKDEDVLSELYPDWVTSNLSIPPPIHLAREEIQKVEDRMRQLWNWIQYEYQNTNTVVLIVSHQESLTALHGRSFKNAEYLILH